jgi:hypothetical protein
VLPADEFRHQYAIPEVDVLAVLTLVLSKSFNGHNTPHEWHCAQHCGANARSSASVAGIRPQKAATADIFGIAALQSTRAQLLNLGT